ncbi:hypothetical protein llap_9909 [Limosa lapponica baueri]|uniref:Uncharacterized protein n=1 Tax=Limosa lapponica baueri TaxID=1758121 RepID=A0A2I0U132_LIMLA|nr:hypothetical protein llap_9909 [Limosa lapponica baueri]
MRKNNFEDNPGTAMAGAKPSDRSLPATSQLQRITGLSLFLPGDTKGPDQFDHNNLQKYPGCPYKERCSRVSKPRDRAATETTENSHSSQAADKEHILSAALKIHDLAIARKQGSAPKPLKVNGTISDLAGSST